MKKFLIAALVVLATTGCGVLWDNVNSSNRGTIRDVTLGMTEQEVTAIMGNGYRVVAMASTPRGDMRTISYSTTSYVNDDPKDLTRYKSSESFFYFIDGRLVEFHNEEYENPRR